mmetsp:Transcript_49261/g.158247  ORF Transcript_49261/g.158247 Transcript_49261/m.158247 type:complete len:91 (+) Transcript_49261:1-273(+)
MGKAVLNQLTMTPLLTLVFVAAWEVMLKKTPVPELATRGVGPISEPFTDRYKRTARLPTPSPAPSLASKRSSTRHAVLSPRRGERRRSFG